MTKKIKNIVLFIVLLDYSALCWGQGLIVGVVRDNATNEGLPGANVQIENTVLGASTNIKGAFLIRNMPYGVYTLRISMMGYKTLRIHNVQVSTGDTAVVRANLKESFVEIDPVVVTASKWAQEASSTPSTIEVMTAKDILARNPVRIEDALATAAGVTILQENVNIRGSDGFTFGIGGRVLVMMDGVPLMTSDMGSVNWFMVSPSDLDRTEIIRGAGSAIHGSSAMGGVINFITRDPGPVSKTYVRMTTGFYDNFEQENWAWSDSLDDAADVLSFDRVDFTHSRQVGNLGMRISGSRNHSTGYIENSGFDRYNISGKFIYNFADNSKLTFFSNYMYDDSDVFVLGESHRFLPYIIESQKGKHQKRHGLTLFTTYKRPVSSKMVVEFRAFLNRFLLGLQVSDLDFTPALGLGGAIQGNYLTSPNLSFVFGADFKYDKTKSDLFERKAVLAAPYVQAEWQFLRNFNLTLGGRYDRYEVLAAPDTSAVLPEAKVFDHFSPKIGLNYHPFESTTIRGSFSNGFKFPVIFQMFFDNQEVIFITFRANEHLKSEESWSYELGLRQEITPSWFFEITGFYSDVKDLIDVGIVSGSDASFFNTADVAIPGLEFVTSGRWWKNRLGLRFNYTYLNPHDKATGDLLSHRQKHIAFVGTSLKLGDVDFQVDYKYASAQEKYLTDPIFLNQFVPQKTMDARILYYHPSKVSLNVGVNNIFNYAYTLRDRYLEPSRSYMFGMSAEF